MVKSLQCRRPGFHPWRRKWQPTPIPLPEEFHGQRNLAGNIPWGCKESDTTEWLSLTFRYSQCLCFTHYPETSMTSTVCWTFPMQRPIPSSLSATGWWSWHPLSWNHSCLSDSEQDNMYMSFSFAWWLLEKSIWFLLFLIYDKIHKNWMGMNYNLRRALTARVPSSLLSRPITNHGCSPFFHSFFLTNFFLSVSTAVSTSLMILIMSQLPQNMYSRK